MNNIIKHINKYNGNLVFAYVTPVSTYATEIDAYNRISSEATTSHNYINSICNFNSNSYLLSTRTKDVALLSLGSIDDFFVDFSPYIPEKIIRSGDNFLVIDSYANKLIKCSIASGNCSVIWEINLSFFPIDANIKINEDLIYISKGSSLYTFKDNTTYSSLLGVSEINSDFQFVIDPSFSNSISYLEYSIKDLEELNIDASSSSSSSSSLMYSESSSSSSSLNESLLFGAKAIYGLRTHDDRIYSGPVIRGRRASDDAELDFYESDITDGTLETWGSGGVVRTVTMYDISGNGYDATYGDALTSKQPEILDATGTLHRNSDGKPSILYDGSLHAMTSEIDSTGVTELSMFAYAEVDIPQTGFDGLISYGFISWADATFGNRPAILLGANNGYDRFWATGLANGQDGNQLTTPIFAHVPHVVSAHFDLSSPLSTLCVDNTQFVSSSNAPSSIASNQFRIGRGRATAEQWRGYISDVILYHSNELSRYSEIHNYLIDGEWSSSSSSS